MRVTNTHNMLVKSAKPSPWRKVKCEELLTLKTGKFIPVAGSINEIPSIVVQQDPELKSSFKRRVSANSYYLRKQGMAFEDSVVEATRRIIEHDSLTYKNPKNLSLDECFFIGFWLGDGSKPYSKCAGGFRYSISQSLRYPIMIQKIEACLKAIGINYNRSKEKPAYNSNFESYTYNLSTGTGFGPQKVDGLYHLIPYLIKEGTPIFKGLSRDQLWELLLGFWYADGNHFLGEKVPETLRINNTNLSLLTLLQEIAVVRGLSANLTTSKIHDNGYKTQYVLSVSKNPNRQFNYGKVKLTKEGFKPEKVWCVETSSGNIITRRNGKVVVMGNCTGFDYPGLSHVILGRPSNSFSLIYQMAGRVVRISPGKFQGTIIDFCGNIENFGKLEDMTIEDYPNYGWGVFSGDRLLTGYSLKGPKVYKKDLVPKKELPKGEGGNYTINIGKFKGQPLSKVKRSYLEYMVFTSGFDFSKGAMKEFYEKTMKYLESTKMQFVK